MKKAVGNNEKTNVWKKILLVECIAVLCSLIPLYLLSQYVFPSADDFFYLSDMQNIWTETKSLWAVLRGAVLETVTRYNEWQGNFSFIFLTFLQPAVLGNDFYFMTPVLILSTFCWCFMYFFSALTRDCMGADRNEFFLISFPLLFCAIHFMYSPVEGIYWHPGAVSYTFFYSLGLLFLSITLRFFYSGRGEKKTVLLFLLAPIIGGSNYSTALVASMILMLLIILLLYQKKWGRAITCAGIEILLITALLISMTAPGNSLRQSTVGEPSVLRGIILSVIYAGYSMANATTVPVLLCWLLISPILYALARRSSLTFRFPLVVWGVLFGVYAALGTPCFYALGYSIPERNINLLYFSYYPIVLTGMFYGFGWISQHLKEENVLTLFFDACLENYGKIFLSFCGLFICACIGLCTVSGGKNGEIRLSNVPTGVSAAFSLLNGEAQTFYLEMTERDAFCRKLKDVDAEVSAVSVYPELLFYSDITEDPLNWQNEVVANYYGNRSIRLQR